MGSKISIVIPTLNEGRNIGPLLESIRKVMDGREYEIIIVDGNSNDDTVEIARKHGAKIIYDDIGKGSALIKGLKAAKGEVQVAMDADLSHEPKELNLLIDGIEAGYDICMGSRFILGGGSDDMPFVRRVGNWVFLTTVNILFHSRYSDMCYGYRSFRKGIFRKLGVSEPGFGIETEINIKAAKKKMRILDIPSMEKKRIAGEGKLRTISDGYVILKTIFKNI